MSDNLQELQTKIEELQNQQRIMLSFLEETSKILQNASTFISTYHNAEHLLTRDEISTLKNPTIKNKSTDLYHNCIIEWPNIIYATQSSIALLISDITDLSETKSPDEFNEYVYVIRKRLSELFGNLHYLNKRFEFLHLDKYRNFGELAGNRKELKSGKNKPDKKVEEPDYKNDDDDDLPF